MWFCTKIIFVVYSSVETSLENLKMALSSEEIQRSAIMAIVLTKGRSTKELAMLAGQLRTPDHRALCAAIMAETLQGLPLASLSNQSPEFWRDLIERIASIAVMRSRAH